MDKINRKIIDSYVAIHDGHTFTLNQIPNGSIVVIKNSSNQYSPFEIFIISKYIDDNDAHMICFSSIINPISGRTFTIDVNKENIWYNYNPENNDMTNINFGFDKKYLEIVAIYDRPITTITTLNTKIHNNLYNEKKYELNTIFLREFKYEYE